MGRRLFRLRIIAGLALAISAAACGSSPASSSHSSPASNAHSATPSAPSWAAALLPQPIRKPEFVLTDTQGKPYDFGARTAGRVTLLYFGYTHCPDACPLTMANLAAALRRLPASVSSKIAVVFVTTDPARDTPSQMKSWLDKFNPSFVGLTGTTLQLENAELQGGMGLAQKVPDGKGGYGINHSAFTLVFTPDGLAHMAYPPSGVSVALEAQGLQYLATRGWPPSA
jgi:protein SCO1/2